MLRRVSFERHCYAKDAKLFATRSVRARRAISDRATLRQASDTLRPSTKMVRGSRAHNPIAPTCLCGIKRNRIMSRSEEHTSELQSLTNLVCRLLLEKK